MPETIEIEIYAKPRVALRVYQLRVNEEAMVHNMYTIAVGHLANAKEK